MNMLNAIEIAELAVLSGSGEGGILVLDLHNGGNTLNWNNQFPSMPQERIDMLGSVVFIQCPKYAEAIRTFENLVGECAENGTSGIISGTITLVLPHHAHDDQVETTSWELDCDTRPIREGTGWRDEIIIERI